MRKEKNMSQIVEMTCKADDLPAAVQEQLGDTTPDTVCQIKVTIIDKSVLKSRLAVLEEITKTSRDVGDINLNKIIRDNRNKMQHNNNQNQ